MQPFATNWLRRWWEYSDKTDIDFVDVNAKSLWPFSTFVNKVLKFYHHFACSERLRKFPIKDEDLYICGRGVRKLPVQYWHCNHCCICIRTSPLRTSAPLRKHMWATIDRRYVPLSFQFQFSLKLFNTSGYVNEIHVLAPTQNICCTDVHDA